MLTVLLLACGTPDDSERPDPPGPPDTAEDTGDKGISKWQFLVYMDGDNNLEDWVMHDLNELELTGSGRGVQVLVQADRIDGYSEKDGDWTGARRYRIEADHDPNRIHSPVLEDLGEVDMGSPQTLADFLAWADTNYPAEHRALVMWDHGDGWTLQADAADAEETAAAAAADLDPTDDVAPPPGIAWDDTDGSFLSIAEGTFAEGLAASVEANGRLDVVAFDACNMATWEVLHSLVPYAEAVSAAETSEGYEGLQYETALAFLEENPAATPTELAQELSRGAVEEGGEYTHSAWNTDEVAQIDAAVDAIAVAALADPDLAASMLSYRKETRGVDHVWKNWYLDAGDLGKVMTAAGDPVLAPLGTDLDSAIGAAVVQSYTIDDYSWASGLTIWFDPTADYIDEYTEGAGATWAQDTHWGELMRSFVKK